MRSIVPSSLRFRLALIIGLLGLLTAFGLSEGIGQVSRRQVESDQAALLTNVAQEMAARLGRDMATHGDRIRFVASRDLLRDPKADPAAKQALLNELQKAYSVYTWIGVTDADGSILAATGGLLVGKKVAQREWFQRGLQALWFGDVHEANLLGALLPPSSSGEPLRLVDVATPLLGPNGERLGVLAAHLSLDWVREVRRGMLDRSSAENIDLAVVDKHARALIGPAPWLGERPDATALAAVRAIRPGHVFSGVQPWADGAPYLTAGVAETTVGTFSGLGWTVFARKPEALAFAPATRLARLTLACAALASLVFAALLWLILARQFRPLEALSAAATRLRRGEPSAGIPLPPGQGEVADFARTLIELVRELQVGNAALKRANRVFEASTQAIALCDSDGLVRRINPAFARLTGYTQSEAVDLPASRFVAELLDPASKAAVDAEVRHSGAWHAELHNHRKDGSAYTAALSVHALRGETGEVENLLLILDDVTERRRSAEALARQRYHLEELLAGRTSELLRTNAGLVSARQEAERANRAKSQFLTTLGHELRTPTNAIVGLANLLRPHLGTAQPPEAADAPHRPRAGLFQAPGAANELSARAARAVRPGGTRLGEHLDGIQDAATHLLGIINDLLDLSKIEAGTLQLDIGDFELGQLMAHARDTVADQAAAKGIALLTELPAEPTRLRGDALRLGQILLKLASNAVKFTQRGSVTLRARTVDSTHGRLVVRFEVADTGPGLTTEQQSRLFQAFEPAEVSSSHQHGGAGLGLVISRRLTVLMGGHIGLDSTPQRGSTFWIELPLELGSVDSPTAGPRAAQSAETRLRRRGGGRILLAEDNPINQEVATGLLGEIGLQVDVAGNGREAVDMVRTGRYELVLMDMQMPVMGGLEAARLIRTLPGCDTLPILAMTANAFEESSDACLAAGMNDHIAKPVQPELLYEALLQWLPPRGAGLQADAMQGGPQPTVGVN